MHWQKTTEGQNRDMDGQVTVTSHKCLYRECTGSKSIYIHEGLVISNVIILSSNHIFFYTLIWIIFRWIPNM